MPRKVVYKVKDKLFYKYVPNYPETVYFITPYGIGEGYACHWTWQNFSIDLDISVPQEDLKPSWVTCDTLDLWDTEMAVFYYDSYNKTWFTDFVKAKKAFFKEFSRTFPPESYNILKNRKIGFLYPVIKKWSHRVNPYCSCGDDYLDQEKIYLNLVDRVSLVENFKNSILSSFPEASDIEKIQKEFNRYSNKVIYDFIEKEYSKNPYGKKSKGDFVEDKEELRYIRNRLNTTVSLLDEIVAPLKNLLVKVSDSTENVEALEQLKDSIAKYEQLFVDRTSK